MRLILVRHGQTYWNATDRIQGRTDNELNEKGKMQAKKISEMLSVEKPVKIFSSPLRRAFDTAKIIASKHPVVVEKRKELKEINYGIFEGKTFKEIEQDTTLNGLWNNRRKNKYHFKPQKGESFEEMNEKRIKPFVQEILANYFAKTVIVVAHSGTNRLIAGNCLHLAPEKMVNIWQPNDLVYFIDCDEKKCYYSHQILGLSKPKTGYLTVDDIKKWEGMFK